MYQKLIDYITDNFIDDHSRPSGDQPVCPHQTWDSLLNHDDDNEIFGDLLKRAQERSRTRLPAIAALIKNKDRDTIRARPVDDDDERNHDDDEEEEEEEEEEALRSAPFFFTACIKNSLIILQIISLTIIHGLLEISQFALTKLGTVF